MRAVYPRFECWGSVRKASIATCAVAMSGHALRERGAHRSAGGPVHHGGDDAEPGVVVYPGDDLGFGSVGQPDAVHDVELP
jgi:hypothetical protein